MQINFFKCCELGSSEAFCCELEPEPELATGSCIFLIEASLAFFTN